MVYDEPEKNIHKGCMNNMIMPSDDFHINDNILSILSSEPKTHNLSGIVYSYLGKGGDRIAYRIKINNKDYCIKVLKKFDHKQMVKDFYVSYVLQELKHISNNIIHVILYDFNQQQFILMELMEGNLMQWADRNISDKNLPQDKRDRQWLEMLFQITYTISYINKLCFLHHDTKPKNIMYRTDQSNTYYTVDNKKYHVREGVVFKIGDFGKVMVIGTTLNKLDDNEIQQMIDQINDLCELSRMMKRIYIDRLSRVIVLEQAKSIAFQSAEFQMEYKKNEQLIEKNLANYPMAIRKKAFVKKCSLFYSRE